MCGLVVDAMAQATHSLVDGDLDLAEHVIANDAGIDAFRSGCERDAYTLVALQAPVARDLRTVVTDIHVAEKLERMGDLARHVAEQVRRSYPLPAVPLDVVDRFAELGLLAVDAARAAGRQIAEPVPGGYADLELADDAVDAIETALFTLICGRDWRHGVAAAIDVALLARFYERFADHAVSIGRRLEFVASGVIPSQRSQG